MPPGGRPNQLCRIQLPGGPKVLLPPGILGYQRQEMALDRKLRKLVKEMTTAAPRDLGDLRDQKGEWLNLEYDLPWALTLHYLRRGDPLFLAAAMAGLTTTAALCSLYLRRLGGITGDAVGATTELFELAFLTALLLAVVEAAKNGVPDFPWCTVPIIVAKGQKQVMSGSRV